MTYQLCRLEASIWCLVVTVSRFLARGWIADLLDRPCHRAGHRGRFGWVPLGHCWSVLRFSSLEEISLKLLDATLRISRGLSLLQLHPVSIPDRFLNHSQPCETFNEPHPQLYLALFQSPISWEVVCSRSCWFENWSENGDLKSRWRTRWFECVIVSFASEALRGKEFASVSSTIVEERW